MADKTANPVLYRKRLLLQRQEQMLAMSRNELRLMELEDEISKTRAVMDNTKKVIGDIESELKSLGEEF